MPLHLLGKKSWNVYNAANIERVRRDEAEARAKEEAEEQRMQEEDAQRRIALLRGENLPSRAGHADVSAPVSHTSETPREEHRWHERKRRRLRGEDDTDRDIRHAREDAEAGAVARQALLRKTENHAPLHDDAGNLQLIPAPDETGLRKAGKNAEAETAKVEKRKRDEDQYTLRFSNAAGNVRGMEKPWYAASNTTVPTNDRSAHVLADVQSKDVWGNEDPLRKEREHKRISSNDPLAVMRQAQRQLKQTEREREVWKEQQKELRSFTSLSSRHRPSERGKRARNEYDDHDSLDEFTLDDPRDTQRQRSDRSRHSTREHSHRRRHDRNHKLDRARRSPCR